MWFSDRRTRLGSCALAVVLAASSAAACSGQQRGAAPLPAGSTVDTSSRASLGGDRWPLVGGGDLPVETVSALQSEVDSWVAKQLLPGVSVAVVGPDGVWTTAVGVDGQGAPLHPESGMALASITKTFTAAEIMLLAERQQLDLDAPASTYVRSRLLADGATIRQLLAHRSSLADADESAYAALLSDPDTPWSPREVLEPVRRPTRPPGEWFGYANINYVLLGLVIRSVTGDDPAVAFRRDLWRPLGLTRLAYQDEEQLAPPLARPGADDGLPHGNPDGAYLPSRSIGSAFGPAGGVAGDALSTARWGYALYGARLLTPRSVRQLTDFSDGDGYGLGTMDYTDPHMSSSTMDAVGHSGSLPGYRTVLAVFPTGPVSIAILSPSPVDTTPYVKWLVAAGKLTGSGP